MIINSNYIYILFTSFTMALVNILFACKYCKYSQMIINMLVFNRVSIKTGKIHIYIEVLCNHLIYRIMQIFIYSIYNIYNAGYIHKPKKSYIHEKQLK